LTPSLKEGSEADLLVEFKKLKIKNFTPNYLGLKISLEALFTKEIDLNERAAILNHNLKEEKKQT
jgi:predicted nucleotidyltransferase